jgi:hypothetical protein
VRLRLAVLLLLAAALLVVYGWLLAGYVAGLGRLGDNWGLKEISMSTGSEISDALAEQAARAASA